MKIEELKNLVGRKPFRPFTINLLNGDHIGIDAESNIYFPAPRPELVIAFTENGRMHIFEDIGIVSLEEPQ
jgi:hypothetical protein